MNKATTAAGGVDAAKGSVAATPLRFPPDAPVVLCATCRKTLIFNAANGCWDHVVFEKHLPSPRSRDLIKYRAWRSQ